MAIAAALATIDIIEREALQNAQEVGDHILARTYDWPQRLPLVGDVRGRGLMIGIEFVADKHTKARGRTSSATTSSNWPSRREFSSSAAGPTPCASARR